MLRQRLSRGGLLNALWGLAIAPPQFGAFSSDLLVGNSGSGQIGAYHPRTGRFLGVIRNGQGRPFHQDHLWSLNTGNGLAGTPQTVLFTAGIGNEHHGLIGSLVPASP